MHQERKPAAHRRTRRTAHIVLAALALATALTVSARAQAVALDAPVTYDNRYELYGGLNLMTFTAGPQLPKKMNFGGVELLGTYWLNPRIGVAVDLRGEYGTSPVLPNFSGLNRVLVTQHMGMVGAQVRGPKNHFAAINYHGYVGVSRGTFDQGTGNIRPENVGLYTNRTKPIGAFGGSVDFNYSKRVAVRISPDLVLTHFDHPYREFFAISGGLIYRFGKL